MTVISDGFIGVTEAALSKLIFYVQPSGNAVAGDVFTTQPVVSCADAYDNPIPNAQISLTPYSDSLCSTDGTSKLSNDLKSSNASGLTAFNSISYNSAQNIFLKASSGNFNIFSFY